MIYPIDQTHNPDLTSWVDSANAAETDFPIQNLPWGVFRTQGDGEYRCGVAIGNFILDFRVAVVEKLLPAELTQGLIGQDLTAIMQLSLEKRSRLRHGLSQLLSDSSCRLGQDPYLQKKALIPQADAEMALPCPIGDYSDFYASVFHATNVGSMFRPDQPLLPNYKHIPIGYHGRASSLIPSGRAVKRPEGQLPPADGETNPTFGPCKNLDYELEIGAFVGRGNALGDRIPLQQAEAHLFGLCLLNDWSARDIQRWEYQPLGPFLAKSFASTISPWVVTMEALAPFRVGAFNRPAGDPMPLPYLQDQTNNQHGGFDLMLEVHLLTLEMKRQQLAPMKLSQGNFRNMYWTLAQMLTHHASNGCNLRTGDLLGSGTISGPTRSERGCLLELTWDGGPDNPLPGSKRTPVELPTGEKRTFLLDGDEVIIRGKCLLSGFRPIGFGECRGSIYAASSE